MLAEQGIHFFSSSGRILGGPRNALSANSCCLGALPKSKSATLFGPLIAVVIFVEI